MSPARWKMTPAMRMKNHACEPNAATGQTAERSVMGTYALACWMACPTSWAATAVAATDRPANTGVAEIHARVRGS